MVATAMPQQLSSIAVSGPPATTPVSGLPTSSSRQSSCIEARPRATASTFSPSALLCGMVSEKSFWNSATRSSGVVRDLAIRPPIVCRVHAAPVALLFPCQSYGEVSRSSRDGGVISDSTTAPLDPSVADYRDTSPDDGGGKSKLPHTLRSHGIAR